MAKLSAIFRNWLPTQIVAETAPTATVKRARAHKPATTSEHKRASLPQTAKTRKTSVVSDEQEEEPRSKKTRQTKPKQTKPRQIKAKAKKTKSEEAKSKTNKVLHSLETQLQQKDDEIKKLMKQLEQANNHPAIEQTERPTTKRLHSTLEVTQDDVTPPAKRQHRSSSRDILLEQIKINHLKHQIESAQEEQFAHQLNHLKGELEELEDHLILHKEY